MERLVNFGKQMCADMTWRIAEIRERQLLRRRYLTPEEHAAYWAEQGYDMFQIAAKLASLREGQGAIRVRRIRFAR